MSVDADRLRISGRPHSPRYVVRLYDLPSLGAALMTAPTKPRPGRVSARLDESRAAKLEYLKRTTGLSTSELVRRGIDLVYEETRRGPRSALAVLTATGFVGSGEGPADLSERTKEYLAGWRGSGSQSRQL